MAVCIHGALLEKESWWAPKLTVEVAAEEEICIRQGCTTWSPAVRIRHPRFATPPRPGLALVLHSKAATTATGCRGDSVRTPLGRYLSSQSWRETDAGLDNRIDSGCRQPLPVALRLHGRPTCRPRTQSMRTRRAAGARCHGDSVVRRFYLLGCSRIVHYSWLL
jgi:hypothetical protein